MAETLRNEVDITLLGETRTMRATFGAIRGVERDLKTNIIPLIERMGRGDVGVEQAAVVIFHGLKGYGDTSLTLDQVGDAVMGEGLSKVLEPVVNFLAVAMQGVSLGKPQAAA